MSISEIAELKLESGETIREFLMSLLSALINEGEGFNSKRPFGNSGWDYDMYIPLIKAGVIKGSIDEDGYLDDCDDKAGKEVIKSIVSLVIGRVSK